MSSLPLVSIITVCYNAEKHLLQCLDSVYKQNYSAIEHIIIDGGSKDSTVSIIKQYATHHPNVNWISEKDKGIYNAMNKGIALAKGEIIGFINADDFYYDSLSVQKAIQVFSETNAQIVHSNTWLQYDLGDKQFRKLHQLSFSNSFNKMELSQNTSFWRKAVFNRVGLFNERYRISSDYDLVLRCVSKKIKFAQSDDAWSVFRIGGISGTSCLSDWENAQIFLKYNVSTSLQFVFKFMKCKVKKFIKAATGYSYSQEHLEGLGWKLYDQRL